MTHFRKIATILFALLVAASFTACASTSTEGTSSTRDPGAAARGFAIDEANRALSQLSYSPGNRGFDYKATGVNQRDFNSWASQVMSQINSAIDAIDDQHVLQVTGHSCSIGPREAVGNRRGNVYYSTERAKSVRNALVTEGVNGDRLAVKGVANDQPLSAVASDDRRNRRVTLQIVPRPAQ